MKQFVFGPIQTKWLKSLEQHPERQGIGNLGEGNSKKYTACCLGELGLIAGICKFHDGFIIEINRPRDTEYGYKYYLNYSYEQVGLRNGIGQPDSIENLSSLAALNDNGTTWPEIAAIVRANPEQYFVKSV